MKQKIFNLGIILSYLTGAMIILNNLIYFLKYVRGGAIADIFRSDVSGSDFLGAALYLVPSLGLAIGITLIVMTFFGLKQRLAWVWFLFLSLILLVPIPILMAQIYYSLTPWALFTLVFAIPAVAFTGPSIISEAKQ